MLSTLESAVNVTIPHSIQQCDQILMLAATYVENQPIEIGKKRLCNLALQHHITRTKTSASPISLSPLIGEARGSGCSPCIAQVPYELIDGFKYHQLPRKRQDPLLAIQRINQDIPAMKHNPYFVRPPNS